MTSIKTFFHNHLANLILVMFAILSLNFVVQARDAFGFMGWVFCFAVVLTSSRGSTPGEHHFS